MYIRNLGISITSVAKRVSVGLTALGLSVAAFAETAATTSKDAESELTEVVVTGTLIRGAAPVGTNMIAVGPEKAQTQGATTANELLATIPQIANLFNNVPTARLNVAPNQIQVVRPNLRNLSPETGSSGSTLVLFDGHRIAGVGVTQSAVDPDIIPVGAIERVEVVTDGGSATYGADAVGGVINFITRKRFDGAKVDARYGFADGYHTYDANLTAGKDWGSGSFYASYMYQKNTALFGRDRGFIRQVDFNTPALTPIGRQCSPGNVTVGATNYALPNLTTPGINACDSTDDTSFVPEAKRNSVLASLHQEFTSALTLDARAFYGERTTSSFSPLRGDATVTSANAFYQPAAVNPTATQQVHFTFAPVLGTESAPSGTHFQEWGVNGELGAKLTDNWRLTTLLNFSRSDSTYFIVGLNQPLLAAAGSASNPQAAVNFYNPAATPNLAVIQAIANSEIGGEGKDSMSNARTILEGSLFPLPGGEVRMAAGLEYLKDKFEQRIAPPNAVRGAYNSVAFIPYDRNVKSAFAELNVPIVGDSNRMGGIYALTLAASGRYDRFSDFGSTNNYKFGLTYKPVDWLALRGNYSTSFNAPGAVDQLGSLRNSISFFPFNAFIRPGETPAPGVNGTVAVQGSQPNLIPQTAKTFSYGFDVDPTAGLHGSVNYYHVAFKNLLGIPTPNSGIFTNFPGLVDTSVNGLSAAQLRAFEALAPNGASVIEPLITANVPVYETVRFLVGNYGETVVSGMDFALNYRHATGFGSIDGGVSGNYTLSRKSKNGAGSPFVDVLVTDTSKLQLQATLGTDVGHLRAQATLNHNSGYDIVRSASIPQDHVSSYDTVNLFFKYNLQGDAMWLKDLALTLNVNNAFDKDPPLYKGIGVGLGTGFANGFTLGRLVMVGVSKTF
jgi:iron complex outermembrane recepter protein